MLSILSYVSGPLYVFLGEVSVLIFCPFFKWIFCLPGVDSCEFFIYFGDQALVQGITGKYVFPYSWFSFHFNAVFFSYAEAFYFDEVLFVHSFFYVPCSRGHIIENIVAWISEIFLPMFSSRTFMVSQLIFKYFVHLECIFVHGVSWWWSFLILHVAVQLSQHNLLKRLFLLHFMPLPPLILWHILKPCNSKWIIGISFWYITQSCMKIVLCNI